MTDTATETRTVVVEREIPYRAGEDLARADAAASDRGMADEERLRAGRRTASSSLPAIGALSTARSSRFSRTIAVLQLGGAWARERRHLDSHPDEQRHEPADGAVGLPCRSGAGLSWRQDGLGQVLRQARAGPGAGRLTSHVDKSTRRAYAAADSRKRRSPRANALARPLRSLSQQSPLTELSYPIA